MNPDNLFTGDNYIGSTILAQLGGAKILSLMIGARDFLAISENDKINGGLMFRFAAIGVPRINKIVIMLNPRDLYDVDFYFLRSNKGKLVSSAKDVFVGDLVRLIENTTGLVLSMGRLSA
jgi:hypothetical protein